VHNNKSKKNPANSKQQTANSKQQTANSKQQTAPATSALVLVLVLASGLLGFSDESRTEYRT
jgi:hypothetical protein